MNNSSKTKRRIYNKFQIALFLLKNPNLRKFRKNFTENKENLVISKKNLITEENQKVIGSAKEGSDFMIEPEGDLPHKVYHFQEFGSHFMGGILNPEKPNKIDQDE